MHLIECLERNKESNAIALHYNERSITYSELYKKVLALSRVVEDLDGEVIGVCASNSIEYVILYFAILYIGKTIFVMDKSSKPNDFILANEKLDIKNYVVDVEIDKSEVKFDYVNLFDVIKKSEYVDIDNVKDARKNETALIISTSGTAGERKYVRLTHENLLTNVLDIIKVMKVNQYEKELVVLPFSAIFANTTQLLVTLYQRMEIFLLAGSFNIDNIIKAIFEKQIDYCEMIPSLLRMIVERNKTLKYDISSLKRIVIGGEPFDANEYKKICEEIAPTKLFQGYGMTEASPVISTQSWDDIEGKEGSCGKPLESVDIKIVMQKSDFENNEIGEIYIKGKSIAKRYCDGMIISDDGWFATGDLGYLDSDNYLYVTGRKKNLIISSGRNISPEEIERILNSYEKIKLSKVFGVENSVTGEQIQANIVVKKECEITDDEIILYCKQNLPLYKVPQKFIRVDEIERNENGKVKR